MDRAAVRVSAGDAEGEALNTMEEISQLVIETEVERYEDGLKLTFHFADDRIEERYVSQIEARDILAQLDRQLQSSANGDADG